MNNARAVMAYLLMLAPVAASTAPAPVSLPASSARASTPGPGTTPAELRELRSRYAQWQALPESERARVREAAHRMASLPPEQAQGVRDTFHAQDARFRDGWRLGPSLGAQYPKLQGLFGFVPADQRDAALAVLRQLSADQLAQLSLVAQRTPPQERDQVRGEFLKLGAADRDRWLREHVVR